MTAHLLYTLWLGLHTKKRDFPKTENHHHGKMLNSAFFSRSEKIEDEAFILSQLISGCREAEGYYRERHYHRGRHSPRYDVPRDQVFINACRQAGGESLEQRIRQKRAQKNTTKNKTKNKKNNNNKKKNMTLLKVWFIQGSSLKSEST